MVAAVAVATVVVAAAEAVTAIADNEMRYRKRQTSPKTNAIILGAWPR